LPPKLDPGTRRAAVAIGERIRAARLAAEVSQETLAAKIGMTRGNYSRIEAGLTNVTLDSLLRIAKGLGITLTVDFESPSASGPRRARMTSRT
jgi:transcriptional regulator with XRE-family HTH domain